MDVMPLAPGMCSGPTSAPPSSMRRSVSLVDGHDRRPDDRAAHAGEAADDDHREHREGLREEELARAEGDVVLRPEPAAGAHQRDDSTHAPSRSARRRRRGPRPPGDPRGWRAASGPAALLAEQPGDPDASARAKASAHQIVVCSGTPNRPVDPRVMSSHDSKTTNAMTSRPIVAMAIAFSSMRVSAMPTTNAIERRRPPPRAGWRARSRAPASITKPGSSGSADLLHRGRDRGQRRDVGADAHERDVAEGDDAGVAGERLDRQHEHQRDQEVDDHALVGRRERRVGEQRQDQQRHAEDHDAAQAAQQGRRRTSCDLLPP